MKEKIYVLDTNVILHEDRWLDRFDDGEIFICSTVLEELEKFKKNQNDIGYASRSFGRMFADSTVIGHLNINGIVYEDVVIHQIKNGKKIHLMLSAELHDLCLVYDDIADIKILSAACFVRDYFSDQYNDNVFFVTNDVFLCIKAHSIGIKTRSLEYMRSQHVQERHHQIIEVTEDVFDSIMLSNNDVHTSDITNKKVKINSGIEIVCNVKKPYKIACFVNANKTITYLRMHESYHTMYGIVPLNVEQAFAMYALLNPSIEIVSLMGKAGTGKTLLAIAAALEVRHEFQQILIARPIMAVSDRDIGFLPGDVSDKIGPYMSPLYDSLSIIKGQFGHLDKRYIKIQSMIDEEKIIIEPLPFIRGRSLNQCFLIIDEAQNLSQHEVKTIVTRAGKGTKIVFAGDIEQIDSPYMNSETNGLSHLIQRFDQQDVYSHINLITGERSGLADLGTRLL